MTHDPLIKLAARLQQQLLAKQSTLATAESCTGGWISKILTDLPGSSAIFDRGFITYSNQAKQDMLDVKEMTLRQNGAVSEAVALEMALGALQHSPADYSVAVSGIAGPEGGSEEKPVGTVCFAWASSGEKKISKTCLFKGNRDDIRRQTVEYALEKLLLLTGD